MYQTQAISEFLETQSCKVDVYHPSMEVQVNVLPGPDRVKSKERRTPQYTDGDEVWSAFRIPFGGSGIDAEPHYRDKMMDWSFDKYVEAIGLTGWDWQNRLSRWVGFDFDSVTNHAKGLTDVELDDLRHRVKMIPWITLRRSKSGKGFHLYVKLQTPEETRNHAEHAALAKAILSHLSGLLNFDFDEKVDTSGGVLWIWHREASPSKKSFEVIKEATEDLSQVPPDWQDYLQVQRARRRVPKRLTDNEASFNDLLSKTRRTDLDTEHQQLLVWFSNNDQTAWWDSERGMLVCHTSTLAKIHEELSLRGVFKTAATGRDAPYDHNCFCFPVRGGAWTVYRYGLGVEEHEYWSKAPTGWTYCSFNKLPNLASASRMVGGVKTKSGEFRFETVARAKKVLGLLGAYFTCPESFNTRSCILAPGKAESEIVVTVPYQEGDKPLTDWYTEGKQKNNKRWERIVNSAVETKIIEAPDEVVRHVSQSGGKPSWFVLSRGRWVEKGKDDIKSALTALDYSSSEREGMLGMAVLEDWQEVVIPFAPEYPGDRKWNRGAPQLAYEPQHGPHPTWDLILEHLGDSLNVENSEWCRVHHIESGSDYLRLWVASLFRHPFEPLPYLFFWSEEQNTGKSTFHEAIQLLLKDEVGYAKADQALTNTSGFNGELYGSVLAVIEEVDVSTKLAYDRVKDWVTSPRIFIQAKHKDGFLTPNTTHWVQCSNDKNYCPVFPGDTRITVGYVPEFKGVEIPKPELMGRLKSEAPYFLYTLLRLDIPPSNSRLRIPVLDSDIKQELEDLHRSSVKEFIEDHCKYTPGTVTHFDLFVSRFIQSLPPDEQPRWTRDKIMKDMPIGKYPRGTHAGELHVGNLTIEGSNPKQLRVDTAVRKEGRKLI